MKDVFISYSRRDQPFVRQLYDALQAANRDPWVDWDGIPPSSEWLKEVYEAIDEADTFVFVLSPDSLDSPTCEKEVTHALDTHKRIFPLVCQHVSSADVRMHEALAPLTKLGWIYFRPTDDFNAAFLRLLSFLDTDLAYWHLASRLLVRATKWDNNRRQASFTLRGKELQEAEGWLATSSDKEPRPSDLQGQYIVASRRAAVTFQRLLLSGVSAALIVTLILSIVSYTQFRSARAAEENVRAELAVADSRGLAAQGINLMADQPGLALLLSVEANRRAQTVEARDSLLRALESHPHLAGFLHGTASGWLDVAISPNGRTLAATGRDGSISLWDTTTRHTIGVPLTGVPVDGAALAFSPDGNFLATGGWSATGPSNAGPVNVMLWSLKTPQPTGTSLNLDGQALAFSPDGKTLALGGCEPSYGIGNEVQLWDTTSHDVAALPVEPAALCVVSIAFSPDGRLIAAIDDQGNVTLDDVAARKYIGMLSVPGHSGKGEASIASMAFSPDGKVLALGGCGQLGVPFGTSPDHCLSGAIQLWDVHSLRPLGSLLRGHSDFASNLAFGPDGKTLVSGSHDNTVILWDTTTGKRLEEIATRPARLSSDINDQTVTVSGDGMLLASASAFDSAISLWNLASDQPLARPLTGIGGSTAQILAVASSPNGSRLAVGGCLTANTAANSFGELWLWDAVHQRLLGSARTTDCPGSVAFSPDGKLLATAVGNYFYNGYDASAVHDVVLWDAASLHPVGAPLSMRSESATTVAFSPDGQLLATGMCGPFTSANPEANRTIGLWDVATRQLRSTLDTVAHQSNYCVNDIAFSPEGKLLAAAVCVAPGADSLCSQSEVQLWDVATGHLSGKPFATDGNMVDVIAFGSDGETLAVLGEYVTNVISVTIWDVSTRQRHDILPVRDPEDMAASQRGTTVAVTSCLSPCNSPQADVFQLWDSGHLIGPVLTLPGIEADAAHVAFSPDGSQLITWGSSVYSWEMSLSDWMSLACHIANRNLTRAEWQQYLGSEPYARTCPDIPES